MVPVRLVPRPSSSYLYLSITATKSLPSNSKCSFSILRYLNPLYQSQGKFGKLRCGIYYYLKKTSIRSSVSSLSASPLLSSLPEMQVNGILTGTEDDHGGVIVEMTDELLDASLFVSLLKASITQWRQQGKKGIWIKLPIELVNLVEPAVKEGFYFHHAEPKYLMLVHWLPSSTNTLPANASHRVGIGAFVMNQKNEMLVVQEKSGRFRGTGLWKLPTGVVDEGSDICDAAVREVKEETGIDTKFVEILAFRQSHKSFFGKSDLSFVCKLEPLSFNIQTQETEIEAAQWMPIEEYAAQPFVQNHELLFAKKDGLYDGFTPVPTVTSFSEKKSYLYLNKLGMNRQQNTSYYLLLEMEIQCGWSCAKCILSVFEKIEEYKVY